MLDEAESAIGLIGRLQSTWDRKNPLAVLIAIALAVLTILAVSYLIDWNQNRLDQAIKSWPLLFLVLGLLFLFVLSVEIGWYVSVRPKKVSGDKIGLIFAIETENNTQKKLIRKNFARDFVRIVLSNSNQEYSVQFVSEYFTKKITTDHEYSKRVLNNANGNLILHGSIEERKKDGNDVYVLLFDECVRHRPISLEASAGIGREMRRVLPIETLFAVSDEYGGFTFSSRVFGLGSKYILGLAAFYSQSLDLAFALLTDSVRISNEMLQAYINEPSAKQIQERLPKAILRVCQRGAAIKVLEEKDFGGGLLWAQRGLAIDPKDYNSNLFASSSYFKLGNYEKSFAHIETASHSTVDYTWAWSKAFLVAYAGRLQEAYELYKLACNRPAVVNAASQCEVFIAETLELEPDKVQLYYCLGLINYISKEDWKLAAEFFEVFIGECQKLGTYKEFCGYAKQMREKALAKIQVS